jgi:hypothetical protein
VTSTKPQVFVGFSYLKPLPGNHITVTPVSQLRPIHSTARRDFIAPGLSGGFFQRIISKNPEMKSRTGEENEGLSAVDFFLPFLPCDRFQNQIKSSRGTAGDRILLGDETLMANG